MSALGAFCVEGRAYMREAARGSIMFFHLTTGSIFQTYLAYFIVAVTQTPHVLLYARTMSTMQLQDAQNEMFHHLIVELGQLKNGCCPCRRRRDNKYRWVIENMEYLLIRNTNTQILDIHLSYSTQIHHHYRHFC